MVLNTTLKQENLLAKILENQDVPSLGGFKNKKIRQSLGDPITKSLNLVRVFLFWWMQYHLHNHLVVLSWNKIRKLLYLKQPNCKDLSIGKTSSTVTSKRQQNREMYFSNQEQLQTF